MAAGQAVDLANANQSVVALSTRAGDFYAWLKMVSARYHTNLGADNASMQAALQGIGYSAPDAAQVVQLINDVDTLIAVFEGTNGGAGQYAARNMIPDLARTQGLTV